MNVVLCATNICLFSKAMEITEDMTTTTTSMKPTNHPTPKPTTHKPTVNPTFVPTGYPSIPPTSYSTHTSVELIDDWSQFSKLESEMSGQICSIIDSECFITCGGYTEDTSENTCQVFNENGVNIYSLIIYELINNGNQMTHMSNFYCTGMCSAVYSDVQLFIVQPTFYTESENNINDDKKYFYNCNIDMHGQLICMDLCNGTLDYCELFLTEDACVTADDQYMYISGGNVLIRF